MRRAAQSIREQHAMAAFHVAVCAVLDANGFVVMNDDGTQWGHGIQMFTTADALTACEQDALSASWVLLAGDPT